MTSKNRPMNSDIPYALIYNEVQLLIAVLSKDGLVLDVNTPLMDLSQLSKDNCVGEPFWELPCWIHSDDMQNRILFALEESAIENSEIRFEAQYKDYLGQINDIDLHIRPLEEANGEILTFLASGFNVTDLVKARKSLSDRERQMSALFEFAEEGYFFNVLPDGIGSIEEQSPSGKRIDDFIKHQKVTRVNRAFKKILGFSLGTGLESNRLYELLEIPGRTYRSYIQRLLTTGEVKFEHELINKEFEMKILEILMVLIEVEGYQFGCFGIIKDLTQQRLYEAELEYYANKDPLTGLNNRRTFFKISAGHFSDHGHEGALCMLDIDHFKKVNDTYGHDMGDEVLREFSKLLEATFSQNATVCRYGGEEFAVLMHQGPVDRILETMEAFRLAVEAMTFHYKDVTFKITTSLGIAEIQRGDRSVEATITRADQALYYSKQHGRNCATIWREGL